MDFRPRVVGRGFHSLALVATLQPMRADRLFVTAAMLIAILVLPTIGAAVAGHDLSRLLEFPPPIDIPNDYRRFSWLAAGLVIAFVVAFGAAWVFAGWHGRPARGRRAAPRIMDRMPLPHTGETPVPLPVWGWIALAWTLAWWFLAWTRFPSFGAVQSYTFFPLWLGFIVTVNALTQWRTGTCLLRRHPGQWLALFGASAVLWWLFEWLNRFVQNWHYLGTEQFGPVGYALHATLCFSTVLPALAAVAEWLASHPRWIARTAAGPAWRWLTAPAAGWALVLAGGAGLVFTGAVPRLFYPALWLAPLALLLGAQIVERRPGVWTELAAGGWQRAATWMLAALICGFFWELWNWRSFPKWIYIVPGVERWHVFEMPLLGYAGYLPFGLECLLVVERLGGRESAIVARPANRPSA